jgi:hypothetical protein
VADLVIVRHLIRLEPGIRGAVGRLRRRHIAQPPAVIGPLLTAVAFGLWVGTPGYWVFSLGFLLWV